MNKETDFDQDRQREIIAFMEMGLGLCGHPCGTTEAAIEYVNKGTCYSPRCRNVFI